MNYNHEVKDDKHQSTADRILSTAIDLFIQHGFDATSISQIANHAGVNRSLIFHHFTNKSLLWIECKKDLLRQSNSSLDSVFQRAAASREAFIDELVVKRFQFYQANPRFVRLMAWQALDQKDDVLFDVTRQHLDKVANIVQLLQQKNEITADLPSTTIVLMISTMISGYFLRNISTWISHEEELQYLETIVTLINDALTPHTMKP